MPDREPCEWCGSPAAEGTCPRSILCPTCKAAPGAACKRPSGHRAAVLHRDRIRMAEGGRRPLMGSGHAEWQKQMVSDRAIIQESLF
jgi:hypothetical protein